MTFAVIGATGKVGREVVRALRSRGADVRVIARSVQRAEAMFPGVEIAQGDLANRASIDRAVRNVDAAFFVTPHDEHEEALGRAFIDACESARVRRIVFASAYRPEPTNATLSAAWLALLGAVAGHYRGKLRVEARVRASRADPVVLMPSTFFQNDELLREAILRGVYAQPIGSKGINRVDCRDIGDAAARAMIDRDVTSDGYPLVGPESLTATHCATVWQRALSRPVRYAGDDLDAWVRAVGTRMSAREISDYRRTYRVLQHIGVTTRARDVAHCTALLQRAPGTYDDYVRRTADDWTRPE